MLIIIFCPLFLLLFSCDGCDINYPQGQGTTSSISQLPTESFLAVTAGDSHACGILEDDEHIKCWGDNTHNQLNLSTAKNAKITLDASHLSFSKISAGDRFTCGMLKDSPYENIPICFGKEGKWLNVPNEPIKDIAASSDFTCFIKDDDTVGCVGSKISVFSKNGNVIGGVPAKRLVKFGISPHLNDVPDSHYVNLSNEKFVTLKAGIGGRVCGKSKDDGYIYCMGGNEKEAGKISSKVLDYAISDVSYTICIDKNNDLKMFGDQTKSFNPIINISNPRALKYKKITSSFDLLTASGNFDDDGSPIPENTLITFGGKSIKDVRDSIEYYVHPERIFCILNMNKKIEKMKLP